jgi:hypothetical protein
MVMPSDKRWVGTGAAAPAPAEGVVGFNNQTIRMNPRLSIGGERLRVRISNAYGNRPLIIGAATIALRDKGATIVAGTGRKLSFGGRDSTVIAAGAVQLVCRSSMVGTPAFTLRASAGLAHPTRLVSPPYGVRFFRAMTSEGWCIISNGTHTSRHSRRGEERGQLTTTGRCGRGDRETAGRL